MADPNEIIGSQTVAEELGVSLRRAQQLIGSGRLKASRLGGNWAVRRGDLAAVRHRPTGRPRLRRQPEMWHGCFGDSWRGIIAGDAFAHPAKFSRGLVERIITAGIERSWWKPGEIIGDPFAGVGTGGIIAAHRGIRWIGVELEQTFHELARKTFDLHASALRALRSPIPEIVRGDSRKFSSMVGRLAAVVTSPPYAANNKADYLVSSCGKTRRRDERRGYKHGTGGFRGSEAYGTTKGQIGRERPRAYWAAMEQVYRECFKAIRPGGYMVVNVRDYVQDKLRVTVGDDTAALLERIGFDPVARVHAMLTRKSFFRQLNERKGSPRIDFEDVIVMRKRPPR